MSKKENKNDVEAFVKDIVEGRNVKAKDRLEKILKVKTARRIKETLVS